MGISIDIISLITTAIGVVNSLMLLNNIRVIRHNETCGGVDIVSTAVSGLNCISWLFYGLIIMNYPLIISNTVASIAYILWVHYQHKYNDCK